MIPLPGVFLLLNKFCNLFAFVIVLLVKAFKLVPEIEESLMRIETRVIMEKYKDNIFSVAFNVCKNAADAIAKLNEVSRSDIDKKVAAANGKVGNNINLSI